MHAYLHAYMRTNEQRNICTQVPTCVYMYIHAGIQCIYSTCMCICTYSCVYTCIHAEIHTPTCIPACHMPLLRKHLSTSQTMAGPFRCRGTLGPMSDLQIGKKRPHMILLCITTRYHNESHTVVVGMTSIAVHVDVGLSKETLIRLQATATATALITCLSPLWNPRALPLLCPQNTHGGLIQHKET